MVASRSPKPLVRVRVFLLLLDIEIWCNGSTRDFGSLSSGSSPDISTILIWRKELTSNALMFVDHSSKVNLRWVPTSGLV